MRMGLRIGMKQSTVQTRAVAERELRTKNNDMRGVAARRGCGKAARCWLCCAVVRLRRVKTVSTALAMKSRPQLKLQEKGCRARGSNGPGSAKGGEAERVRDCRARRDEQTRGMQGSAVVAFRAVHANGCSRLYVGKGCTGSDAKSPEQWPAQ